MIERDDGRWDEHADVVVVGGGGCGLCAALAAAGNPAAEGLRVRVLEKADALRGNTGRSGGMIPAAGSAMQRAAGIHDSAEAFAADIFEKNGHASDPEATHHLCRTAPELIAWLTDEVGIELVFIADFTYPGHRQYRMHAPPSRTGDALMNDLRRAAEAHPAITITTHTPARGLVADAEGAVTGVLAEDPHGLRRLRAGKVILASNGFAGNRAMLERYCPEIASARYFGAEGNQGEAIVWGEALGGETAFMDAYQAHASVAVEAPILITYSLIMEGGIQVNAHGQRFADESRGYSEHALEVLAQPGGTAWDLYGERQHQLGLQFRDYREALTRGLIRRGESLAALAAATGLEAAALEATLERYHAAADGRQPDPFGRRDCRRLDAPFYAVEVTGALFHTQGGLRVDEHARVRRAGTGVIANLYAGGGVAAGISGHGAGGYLSGNGLLTALGYGMLAGRHAARSLRGGN